MKKEMMLFLLVFLVACTNNNAVDERSPAQWDNGITREISKTTVSPGEEITVNLHVVLLKNQTYYLAEEKVPKEIKVLDGKPDKENVLKIIKIQDAKNTIISYRIKAPETKGSYTFSGEYAVEGMKDPKGIMGNNKLFVR